MELTHAQSKRLDIKMCRQVNSSLAAQAPAKTLAASSSELTIVFVSAMPCSYAGRQPILILPDCKIFTASLTGCESS